MTSSMAQRRVLYELRFRGRGAVQERAMDEDHGLARAHVADVVRHMMLFPGIKWVAIIYENTVDGVDRFNVVPYTSDPTS